MTTPIALTYAQKPHEGQVWKLHRTDGGFELRHADDNVVTAFPAAEAAHLFRFPSFWASVRFLEVRTLDGITHYFRPEKDTVAAVKAQVEESLGHDPDTAAPALRRKAGPALGLGLLLLAVGLGITAATYLHAIARPEGGTYLVATGLIGFGVANVLWGLTWYNRASRLQKAAARKDRD